MQGRAPRTLKIVLLSLLLAGCGGGGGGDGSSGGSNPPPLTFTLSTTSVEVSAQPGESEPRASVTVTVANVPPPGEWSFAMEHGTPGFVTTSVRTLSPTVSEINLRFQDPLVMGPGEHRSTLRIGVCVDPRCNVYLDGGMRTINLRYDVGARARLLTPPVDVAAEGSTFFFGPGPWVPVPLEVVNPPERLYVRDTVDGTGVRVVLSGPTSLNLGFEWPRDLGPGMYEGRVTARLCYDHSCMHEIEGSPAVVNTRYTVTDVPPADPEAEPVPVLRRDVLAHDVVDAAFSAARGAVVMASATPRPALHLRDPHSGLATEILLDRLPTALSIAPDGLSAVVGHDGAVSHVVLPSPGMPAMDAPAVFPVSVPVHGLQLDGRGRVHIVPNGIIEPAGLHTLDLANGGEVVTEDALLRRSRLRLHPGGDFLLAANRGQMYIRVFDIRSGQAVVVGDETTQGTPAYHCENIWTKEDGAAVYTRCGQVFAAPADLSASGLTPAGNLALTDPMPWGTPITALSQSDALGEILALEAEDSQCLAHEEPLQSCLPRLRRFDSASLAQLSLHSTGFVELDGRWYAQRALYLFHGAGGSGRYMLSRTHGAHGAQQFMLSVLDP
jgi:hypothetical protein